MKKKNNLRIIFAGFHVRYCLILSFITVVFICGCAPPAVKTTILLPASSYEAAQLRQVAVLPFDGRQGREFATEIEAILANVSIDNKAYFTLVDRSKLDQVVNEMKLSQSGFVQEGTVAKIGKMVGARGIYSGAVTQANSSDSRYSTSRSRCAHFVKKKDKKGREYEDCERYENYSVPCVKRTARFSFTPKLTDVETGLVVYSNNLSGTAEASGCSDDNEPVESASELINKAKRQAMETFRNDVAPHYAKMTIKIMDGTDGITSDAAKEKFESALDFSKKERYDRACELWGEANALSPNSVSILYNLGVCAEMSGNFDQALDLYNKAERQAGKPDKRISEAIKRVSDSIKKQRGLRS
jgi:hypothetical protein